MPIFCVCIGVCVCHGGLSLPCSLLCGSEERKASRLARYLLYSSRIAAVEYMEWGHTIRRSDGKQHICLFARLPFCSWTSICLLFRHTRSVVAVEEFLFFRKIEDGRGKPSGKQAKASIWDARWHTSTSTRCSPAVQYKMLCGRKISSKQFWAAVWNEWFDVLSEWRHNSK